MTFKYININSDELLHSRVRVWKFQRTQVMAKSTQFQTQYFFIRNFQLFLSLFIDFLL